MRTKLKKVSIAGYKSISSESPITLEFGDVNILLGANGVGKSNIISFFRMLNYMMSGSLQKFVALNGSNSSLLYYGPKITHDIIGKMVFSDDIWTDYYDFTLSGAAGQKLIITDERILYHSKEWQDSNPRSRRIKSNYEESGLVSSKDNTSRAIRNLLSQCKAFQFHDSSMEGPLRTVSSIDNAQYLYSDGKNIAWFLYFLRDNYPQSYKRIVQYIQMIMPTFQDFYLEPLNNRMSLNWKDINSPNDYVFTSDQLSDGTIRFIALATLLLQPEATIPQMIIIDEPELGLHPYAINQLSEMIKDASIHAQILVSTQSPQLIDCFPAESITVIEQNDTTKATTARKLDMEALQVWMEHYSLSDLWQKNVIGGMPL